MKWARGQSGRCVAFWCSCAYSAICVMTRGKISGSTTSAGLITLTPCLILFKETSSRNLVVAAHFAIYRDHWKYQLREIGSIRVWVWWIRTCRTTWTDLAGCYMYTCATPPQWASPPTPAGTTRGLTEHNALVSYRHYNLTHLPPKTLTPFRAYIILLLASFLLAD